MIIRLYTSGTMQTSWRSNIEQLYRDQARESIAARWAAEKIPPDYLRPREDIGRLHNSVVWLHPRPPIIDADGVSATRASFYVPRNLRLIHDCDFVLSCIYPGYSSVDSAHEIGVAYAWSKPIVTVDLTHGLGDYSAWRAMSLVVLDSLELAAEFLLYQVQDEDYASQQLNLQTTGDKIPA